MTSKITRPFPVPATVVIRSTLFALAGMNATLHTYNEESGVIVASVSKWLGVQKQEVVARVRGFDDTAQLELEVPDQAKAQELLSLIARYVSDGAKIEAAATIQWVDLERQRASKAKRQDMLDRAKRFLPGVKKGPTADPEIVEAEVVAEDGGSEPTAGAESTALTVSIPDNPQVLVKDPQSQMIDLKVDPEIFKDRSTYLMTCQHCAATNLRGSFFCAACGKPLTLEAIQPDLKGGVDQAAKKGLTINLLSDPDHDALTLYGAWGKKKMYGKEYEGVIRSTVLIDPNGVVRQTWPKVKTKGHAAQVLETLKEQLG